VYSEAHDSALSEGPKVTSELSSCVLYTHTWGQAKIVTTSQLLGSSASLITYTYLVHEKTTDLLYKNIFYLQHEYSNDYDE